MLAWFCPGAYRVDVIQAAAMHLHKDLSVQCNEPFSTFASQTPLPSVGFLYSFKFMEHTKCTEVLGSGELCTSAVG
jgi:hypothetical protein